VRENRTQGSARGLSGNGQSYLDGAKVSMTRKGRSKSLVLGDVLRTHPFDGYWGCAIVLTVRDKTNEFGPMCHIGITPIVFTQEFDFDDLNDSAFEILRFNRSVRVAPYSYASDGQATCIGVYSRRITPSVVVIGNIDPSSVHSASLKFVAGNGADGGWPFCGKVEESLGGEAVHSWRVEHDREQWVADIAEAEKSHEEMLMRLKEKREETPNKTLHQNPDSAVAPSGSVS
jgi:hypothetical protein